MDLLSNNGCVPPTEKASNTKPHFVAYWVFIPSGGFHKLNHVLNTEIALSFIMFSLKKLLGDSLIYIFSRNPKAYG